MTIWTVPATVLRVVDGDTVRLLLDLGWHVTFEANVRVVGVNAPELGAEEGRQAKAYAQTLLPAGAQVTFVSRQLDKYGRPLGTITCDKGDFGQLMLAAGHAARYPRTV